MKLAEVNLLQIQQPLTSPRRAESKSDANFGQLVETAVRQSQRPSSRAESGDGEKTEAVKAEPAAVDAGREAPADEDVEAVEAPVVKQKDTDKAPKTDEREPVAPDAADAEPVAGAIGAGAAAKDTADVKAKGDADAAAVRAAAGKVRSRQAPVEVKPEAINPSPAEAKDPKRTDARKVDEARLTPSSDKQPVTNLTLETHRVAQTRDGAAEPSIKSQGAPQQNTSAYAADAAKLAQQTQANAAGEQASDDQPDARPQAKSPAPVQADSAKADGDAAKVQQFQQVAAQAGPGQTASNSASATVQLDASQVTVEATATTTTSPTTSHTTPSTTASAAQQAANLLPDDLTGDDAQRLTDQSVRALRSVVNQKGGSVTLRLSPPELGALRVQVQMDNGVVRAQIDVGNSAVRSLLQQQLSTLRTALESHGLTVQHLEVNAPLTSHAGQHSGLQQDGSDDGRSRGQFQQSGSDAGGSGSGEQPGEQSQGQGRPPSRFERELLDLVV